MQNRAGHSLLCIKSSSSDVEGVCPSSVSSSGRRDIAGGFLMMWVVFIVQPRSSGDVRSMELEVCYLLHPLPIEAQA